MAFNFWRLAVIPALLAAFFAGVTYFPAATPDGLRQTEKVMLRRSGAIVGSLKVGSRKSSVSRVSPVRLRTTS